MIFYIPYGKTYPINVVIEINKIKIPIPQTLFNLNE